MLPLPLTIHRTNDIMVKTGTNNPCPCGSGKKYRNCCLNKKPREEIVIVGSPERLRGFHYDKDKMELMGLTLDGRLIKPNITFSQSHYIGQSGKEKAITRVQEKVIPNEAELMRHLSSFDKIIAVDTNTKIIESETVSVTGVVHCIVQETSDPTIYAVDFPSYDVILFRNCPSELPSEKFGWMTVIRRFNHNPLNETKRVAIVTDHDLDNHTSYNSKQIPIFRDFYLPDNIKLMYGRGDGSTENLLNDVVKRCDKKSTEVLREIEKNQYYQHGDEKISITQIPMPSL
jgi:hypothetical protein